MFYFTNMFNTNEIKNDFPVFRHYPDLIFTDNASTTQKPQMVIDAVRNNYEYSYANIHRAVYELGVKADKIYSITKKKILSFFNLSENYEVIYTSGTTDGLNKLAYSLENKINPGDNIIVSEMEHHSNFLPWQELCRRSGCELRVIPITDAGDLDMDFANKIIDSRTKIIAITHISNTLGTINELDHFKSRAPEGCFFIVDAAQSASFHGRYFKNFDADFIVSSGHKMFGPSGIGFILIKKKHILSLPPSCFGGGMVIEVEKSQSFYKEDITKFEAGTPPIAQIAGLGAAIDYLSQLDQKQSANHLHILSESLRTSLAKYGRILGEPVQFSGVVSVFFEDIHPHDAATFLNSKNIAVRAGHHCTQLIMKKFEIPASVRFSFSIYNSLEEVEKIEQAVHEMQAYFL